MAETAKPRRKTLGRLGRALTLLGMALSATAPAFAADAIKLGALRFTSHSGAFLAQEKGYFKAAGLEVELVFFQAAQPMAVAIASGDLDFGVTAITGGLINLADKGAIKVIGGALTEDPAVDGQKILVSNAAFEAGLVAPDKLAGRRFGITQAGSSFHYMAAQIADQSGVVMDQIRLVPLQKVGVIIGALKSGQIDAWSIQPHIAKSLSDSGAAKIIGRVADYIPDYQVTTIFTSARHAAQDGDLTRRFLKAYGQGVADFNRVMVDKAEGAEAIEAMTRVIHRYVYASRPYEKAAPSIQAGAMRLQPAGRLNLGSVRHQLDWFKAEGLVGADITLEQLVDTRYVETY